MVKLKEKYSKNGYDHEMVWRDENYAITKLTDSDTGKFVCYEAFRIRIKKSGPEKSTAEYPRECTPSNEEWGKFGFSTFTFEQAKSRIDMMANRKNKSTKTNQNGN